MACLVAGRVSGHPLCFINDKPTDVDQELTFCPAAQDGACCNTEEEVDVKRRLDELNLTDKCYDMYKQVRQLYISSRPFPSGFLLSYSLFLIMLTAYE